MNYGSLPPDSIVWHVRAKPDESRHEYGVVDGDTVDLIADLGFRVFSTQRFRLYGVDTAEIHWVSHDSEEYERGSIHKQFTYDWIVSALEMSDREWPIRVYTLQDPGSFNRWLADFINEDGESLVASLFNAFGDEVKYE